MSRVAVPDDGGDTILNTDFGEVLAPCVPDPVVGKQIFDKIPDLPIKEDDIMLCTYIKTGRLIEKWENSRFFYMLDNIRVFFKHE